MFYSPLRLSSPITRVFAQALDAALIWLGGLLAFDWYSPGAELLSQYSMVMLAASLVFLLLFSPTVYRSWRADQFWVMLRAVSVGWTGTVLLILIWLFLTKASADFSRLWVGTWAVGTLVLLCLVRLAAYSLLRWLRTQGFNYKTVLLVGDGATSLGVRESLAEASWSGFRVVATVAPGAIAPHLPERSQGKIDEVWICLPLSDEAGIRAALQELRHSTANIRLVPDMFALKLINHGVSEVVGIPMLDLSASPMTGRNRLLKAVEDYTLALLILLLVAPLMLGIALAVKFSSRGPVLFRQPRLGWNGEEIVVYKFRSMVVHDEDGGQVSQARKDDARLTRVGAFLRRTSLDELPQFINVLQGRMSIVGPRPHALAHNEYYKELVPGYMLRHKVKPGITGWAQINGFRGETDTLDKMSRRVEYDLRYIENWSIWLDLSIIVQTIFRGFVHQNAY